MQSEPYLPAKIFNAQNVTTPRVMVAPQRYIQGPGVLNQIHRYLSVIDVGRVGILASRRGMAAEGNRIIATLKSSRIDSVEAIFDGECSLVEIEKHDAVSDNSYRFTFA